MENLLSVVEQFLNLSDEKLEDLAEKNQKLRLQEEKERKNAEILNYFVATEFFDYFKSR